MLILKILDPNQKIRLWGRALPWLKLFVSEIICRLGEGDEICSFS